MDARVVVGPDRAVDLGHELAQVLESGGIAEIDFQFVVERLLIAVLPGAARSRAGNRDAARFENLRKRFRHVLPAVVRVEDRGFRTMHQCLHERFDGERGAFPHRHVYRDDPPHEDVEYRRNIHPLPAKHEFRENRRPHVVRIRGADFEQKIRERLYCLAFPVRFPCLR